MRIDARQTLERIAREHPEALEVFARHRLDPCCGGKLSLEEAARRHGLDLAALLRELEEASGVVLP
jgi:regulator of cell morphogenesis and NO signaling